MQLCNTQCAKCKLCHGKKRRTLPTPDAYELMIMRLPIIDYQSRDTACATLCTHRTYRCAERRNPAPQRRIPRIRCRNAIPRFRTSADMAPDHTRTRASLRALRSQRSFRFLFLSWESSCSEYTNCKAQCRHCINITVADNCVHHVVAISS